MAALLSEQERKDQFPVTGEGVFLAHAGVTVLPRAAADALRDFADRASLQHQENLGIWRQMDAARAVAAKLLGAQAEEIALLGPTSLGLNIVANGFPWQEGDEVVYHADDYPANAYPWLKLASRGVRPVLLRPEKPGWITPELVERALTPRTRLVALASAHFLSGYRIDLDAIGRLLHARGVYFCLDAIQTAGAFPTRVDHVDFLSADSHKWMLGPVGAGIVMIKQKHFGLIRPDLLGSWNVVSPDFIAQEKIEFYPGGRRYEPGVLNIPGILGMKAALELILRQGVEAVAERILELRAYLVPRMEALGFSLYAAGVPREAQSGIITFSCPAELWTRLPPVLEAEKITVSFRRNRAGQGLLRVSPHFYNTEEDLDRLLAALRGAA
jgi:selenocysteine lyase/cysteine desulfurase